MDLAQVALHARITRKYSSEHKRTIEVICQEAQYPNPFGFFGNGQNLTEGQFDSVGRFEDDPLTGHEDVVMVMDVAIDLVRLEMELAANLKPTYH